VDEDNVVLVSRDGWVKRQKEVKDLSTTRMREGDGVLAAVAGSTRATVVFFSNFGSAYTCRIIDVPASTGYGTCAEAVWLGRGARDHGLQPDPRVRGTAPPPLKLRRTGRRTRHRRRTKARRRPCTRWP
jgi:DNA gyrase subunit A